MKSFLRKLHIGDSAGGDGASSPAPPVAPPPPPTKKGGEHKAASGLSGWLSSVTGRPHAPPPIPPPPLPSPAAAAAAAAAEAAEVEAEENALATALASSVEERRVAREEESRKEAEDERKREAEVERKEKREAELEDYHMQLALEMSVREDPEAMQIEVAKQISLGSCPLQSSPAEVVAFRYWVLSISTPPFHPFPSYCLLLSRLFPLLRWDLLVLCSCELDVRAEMGFMCYFG